MNKNELEWLQLGKMNERIYSKWAIFGRMPLLNAIHACNTLHRQ